MSDEATALLRQEQRAASRLARLFRIERRGGFSRRPADIAERLVERRGRLVEELARVEATRRSLAPSTTIELNLAMAALATEVDLAEQYCLERIAEIGDELGRRAGAGTPSGLHELSSGRLLGRG